MLDRSGSVEGFFAEGYEAGASDVGAALDSFSRRALALDAARHAAVEAVARRLLFLSRGRPRAARASG